MQLIQKQKIHSVAIGDKNYTRHFLIATKFRLGFIKTINWRGELQWQKEVSRALNVVSVCKTRTDWKSEILFCIICFPNRTDRRRGLLHRCRLFLSWLCRSNQGCGCSPIKRDHELGSERCEAVCLISTGDADVWMEGISSTRGTESRRLWSTCCLARQAGQLRAMG